jgi:hypothetical protein
MCHTKCGVINHKMGVAFGVKCGFETCACISAHLADGWLFCQGIVSMLSQQHR